MKDSHNFRRQEYQTLRSKVGLIDTNYRGRKMPLNEEGNKKVK